MLLLAWTTHQILGALWRDRHSIFLLIKFIQSLCNLLLKIEFILILSIIGVRFKLIAWMLRSRIRWSHISLGSLLLSIHHVRIPSTILVWGVSTTAILPFTLNMRLKSLRFQSILCLMLWNSVRRRIIDCIHNLAFKGWDMQLQPLKFFDEFVQRIYINFTL